MREQDRQDYPNYRANPAPTLTTLTQSDHDIIRTFLSSVPAGFPLSPGAALAELTGFAPLSPSLVGLAVPSSSHNFHQSSPAASSRFDPGSPGRFASTSLESQSNQLHTVGYKSRNVLNSPLRIHTPPLPPRGNVDSPLRLPSSGITSPQRLGGIALEQGTLKRFENFHTYSPIQHRRSPSPNRSYHSPYRINQSKHVYAPILPSRAYEYTTPAHSPPPPALAREDLPERLTVPVNDTTAVVPSSHDIRLALAGQDRLSDDHGAASVAIVDQTEVVNPSDNIVVVSPTTTSRSAHHQSPAEIEPTLERTLEPSLQKLEASLGPTTARQSAFKSAHRKCKRKKKPGRVIKSGLRSDLNTKATCDSAAGGDLTVLEKTCNEVETRLKTGCSCGQGCLERLDSEAVFKHRTNIAKLNKGEHNMYLMGMMMATLGDSTHTTKYKERKRMRNKYIYQGSEVCQEAYVYLENVSIYHLKLIRKHVTENGVVPKQLHKNSGKKSVNAISTEHHREAHLFIQELLASENSGRKKGLKCPTFKYLHQKYRNHFNALGTRTMEYSTFRKFINAKFPLIKFRTSTLDRKARVIVESQDNINLPQHSVIKSDTQIMRNLTKTTSRMGAG